jgi:hypothetical protein
VRKVLDRRASAEYPEAKRLLGALTNSRGHRHEENASKLAAAANELPLATAAALLASAEGYTPRSNQTLDTAREELGSIQEVANGLADDLPAPKTHPGRRRRRRRKKKPASANAQAAQQNGAAPERAPEAKPESEPAAAENTDA